jgi:outer membrane protein TolC
MKKITFPILFLLLSGIAGGQQRDLAYYLENAKNNSPLINKTRNENKLADLDLEQIRSVLAKPEINLESAVLFAPIVSHDNDQNSFQFVSEGATDYNGYDLASTEGGQYLAVVSVRQPLFNGSKLSTYSNKAEISKKLNENNIALTLHEIEQLVSYQYILCLKSKLEIGNSLFLIKEVEEQLILMKKLVEYAIYRQKDYMLLQIEYQNHVANNKSLKSEYRNNIYDLNLLCGISDTSIVEIQDIDLKLNPSLASNSQFLTSYRLDSMNIIADQAINDLKYKVQADLFANAGLNAVYLPAFNRLGFSTGLLLSWNIFDGNQRKIQNEKSIINIQTLEFEKSKFLTQKDISRNKFFDQINLLDQRILMTENQIKQYESLYNVYKQELSLGEISVMDYKNLLKDAAAKKHENVMLKMEKQVLINSYNYWNY